MKAKYRLGQKIKVPITKKENGVVLKGIRSGVIDTIQVCEHSGDYYSVTHSYKYRIVDDLYGCKNPIWVEENKIKEENDEN